MMGITIGVEELTAPQAVADLLLHAKEPSTAITLWRSEVLWWDCL